MLAAAALLLPASAFAVETNEIAEETIRTRLVGSRVVNFWWLPGEYWVAAARKLGKTQVEVDEIRALFSSYNVLAALDVQVRPDGSFDALSTAEIVRRAEIQVNGKSVEVLQQVDQRMQELVPELTYVLSAALGTIGRGMRLLPLPNVDEGGKSILTASTRGTLRVRYAADPVEAPAELWWHSPLTSVKGAKRCENGAPAEASWKFCPWDGEALD